MTNEELDILWFKAMRQSVEEDKAFIRYHFAALVAAAEREKVAAWMRSKSYATGHGDTVEDLLKEMEWQVAEREREACARACDEYVGPGSIFSKVIRARGEA